MTIELNKLVSSVDTDPVSFNPTREQQQAKSSFWSFFMSGDVVVAPTRNVKTATRYGRASQVREWWDLPGFQEWFYNKDEFRQRAEFLANQSLTHLESILFDAKAPANAKVGAIKLIMELANRLPKAGSDNKEQYLDAKVSQMNREELEEFISNRSGLLLKKPDSDQEIN